jgi:transcriptional regulator with XRE-family HTH domain
MFLKRSVSHLLIRARQVIGLSQGELATRLRSSKRTVSRWETGASTPSVSEVCDAARLVYGIDATLAAELAAAAGETVVSLGLVTPVAPPAAPPPIPSHLVVDAVVCVAADALGAAPSTVRAALYAAFRRTRELRLTVEDVEKALAPATPAGRASKTT